jgi:hypothetical protein
MGVILPHFAPFSLFRQKKKGSQLLEIFDFFGAGDPG